MTEKSRNGNIPIPNTEITGLEFNNQLAQYIHLRIQSANEGHPYKSFDRVEKLIYGALFDFSKSGEELGYKIIESKLWWNCTTVNSVRLLNQEDRKRFFDRLTELGFQAVMSASTIYMLIFADPLADGLNESNPELFGKSLSASDI